MTRAILILIVMNHISIRFYRFLLDKVENPAQMGKLLWFWHLRLSFREENVMITSRFYMWICDEQIAWKVQSSIQQKLSPDKLPKRKREGVPSAFTTLSLKALHSTTLLCNSKSSPPPPYTLHFLSSTGVCHMISIIPIDYDEIKVQVGLAAGVKTLLIIVFSLTRLELEVITLKKRRHRSRLFDGCESNRSPWVEVHRINM